MSALARARELAALVDEFAPPGWRRAPGWWATLGLAAALEPWGRGADAPYLISDGGPAADTFMAALAPRPRDGAGWIAWAIAAAHAAVDAVARLDGTLPAQPLAVAVTRTAGAAAVTPLPQPRRAGFAIGGAVWYAELDRRGPAHEAPLALALAAALRGAPTGLARSGPPPQVVVALGDDAPSVAHHGHRRAWRADGGPWLGVAWLGPYVAVSTCHLVVDGWGHAALTHAIAAAPPVTSPVAAPPPPPLVPGAGPPLALAWGPIAPAGAIASTYALGVALHAAGDRRAPRSPPLQLPVAPGRADDPTRFARRVRPALVAVRFIDGRPEPLPVFAARARAAIAREAAGAGVATRLLTGLHGLPVPLALKRRALAGPPTRLFAPPAEHLAGDGCLSYLRVTDGPPLVAASAPPPHIPRTRAAAVLTVVVAGDAAVATVAATGPDAPEDLLGRWRAALAALSPGGARPASR